MNDPEILKALSDRYMLPETHVQEQALTLGEGPVRYFSCECTPESLPIVAPGLAPDKEPSLVFLRRHDVDEETTVYSGMCSRCLTIYWTRASK